MRGVRPKLRGFFKQQKSTLCCFKTGYLFSISIIGGLLVANYWFLRFVLFWICIESFQIRFSLNKAQSVVTFLMNVCNFFYKLANSQKSYQKFRAKLLNFEQLWNAPNCLIFLSSKELCYCIHFNAASYQDT